MRQTGHPASLKKLNLLYLIALSLGSGLALAEEKKAAHVVHVPESAEDVMVVDVTARHGEEKLKDVPFGISVQDGTELESNRRYSLDSALRSIPGVDISTWGSAIDTNIRIRGVGSLYQVSMDDNSVVLNIDGVSVSSRYLPLGALDVKQIEVLKGPQGTLYGRSGSAGAVNVVTNKPTEYFEGHITAEYGQDNQHLEEAVLSGPLGETLSGRFAIRNSGSDSWVTNLENDKPVTEPRSLQFRGSLLWQPTERTSALLTMERQDARQLAPLMVLLPYGDQPKVGIPPGTMDDNKSVLDRYSLEASYDLAASRLTSITAMTRLDYQANKAYDKLVMNALYGAPNAYVARDDMGEDVFSQELRWQSLPEEDVFWVGGMNYFHSTRNFDAADSLAQMYNNRDFTTDSYALYGEVTYPLTPRLKLTGGLRETWDRKAYDARYRNRRGTSTDHRVFSESHTTGRTALSYAITPQTNVYGAFAAGSKPGGYNDYATSINDSTPYEASRVYTAELGVKSDLLNGALSLNGSLFASKVRDDHLMSYDINTMAAQAVTVDTRSYGMEFEGRWHINRQWSLAASGSYLDAEIASDAKGVSGGDVAAGNQVPDIPRWSGNLNARYLRELPPFLGLNTPMLNVQANYRLVGKRPADPQNHFDLGSYGKLDSRISLINGNAEFYVWGDNLLNEQYDMFAYWFSPTVQIGMPARGRTVGAGFKWYF